MYTMLYVNYFSVKLETLRFGEAQRSPLQCDHSPKCKRDGRAAALAWPRFTRMETAAMLLLKVSSWCFLVDDDGKEEEEKDEDGDNESPSPASFIKYKVG